MDGPQHERWSVWRPVRNLALVRLHIMATAMRAGTRPMASGHGYSLTVAGAALVLTISAIPFASILVAAVLLRRERWLEIVALSALGSATGGLVLYLLFHHLAWAELAAIYPDLVQSKAWVDATQWISAYGAWALLGIAAMPLPQTPALIFTAISRLPVAEVFLALFLGKLLKYGVYGFLAARFPSWFRRLVAAEHRSRA